MPSCNDACTCSESRNNVSVVGEPSRCPRRTLHDKLILALGVIELVLLIERRLALCILPGSLLLRRCEVLCSRGGHWRPCRSPSGPKVARGRSTVSWQGTGTCGVWGRCTSIVRVRHPARTREECGSVDARTAVAATLVLWRACILHLAYICSLLNMKSRPKMLQGRYEEAWLGGSMVERTVAHLTGCMHPKKRYNHCYVAK